MEGDREVGRELRRIGVGGVWEKERGGGGVLQI